MRHGGTTLLLIGLVLLVTPTSADACGDCGFTSGTLVGWSADGSSWAVIERPQDQKDQEYLAVYKNGKLASVVHSPDSVPAQAPKMHSTTIASTYRYSAMERIDVQNFAPLREFKLLPVRAAWRRQAKKHVTVKKGGTWKPAGASICMESEVVTVAGKKWKTFGRECYDEDTGSSFGAAYLHPSGDKVMLKYASGGGCCYFDSFVVVPLRK